MAAGQQNGATIDHGKLGLGPTGNYPPSKVPLVNLGRGRIGGPWSLVSYVPSDTSMEWWDINVNNASTLFTKDEKGVYNILKYVYDIVYLRAHGVEWHWEITLQDIANAARKYADYEQVMAFLGAAFDSSLPKNADDITKEVWKKFLDAMEIATKNWLPPNSPPVNNVTIPSSPPTDWLKRSQGQEDYEPGVTNILTDEEDEDPWGFNSPEEVQSQMIQAIRRNDYRAVERLALYCK